MFENYLAQLPGQGEQMIPGQGGLENALAQNQHMGMAQQQQQQPRGPHGLMHILGLIGATLASARGRPAPYMEYAMQERQNAKQQQANQAFANYLGDPELAALISGGASPDVAVKAYGIKHPEAKEMPADARLWEYRNSLPPGKQAVFDKFLDSRRFNPYAAPISMGPGDTLEYPGGEAPSQGAGEVTATNPQTGERVRLNPQSGQWEPMGGPTPQASGGFPQ